MRQKRILLWLDKGSEPLNISFDYETLEFCNYFKSYSGNNLNKCGFFCKTQYAKSFLCTHHTACKLLETIKKQYVKGLKVSDDGEHYGNWDIKVSRLGKLSEDNFHSLYVANKFMEHKKAADVLINMLNKRPLDAEEKDAVLTAVGVLAWTSLSKSKVKALKAKRDKSSEGK